MSQQRKTTPATFSQQTRFFIILCTVGVIAIGSFFFQTFGETMFDISLRTNDSLNKGLLAQWTFDAGTFSGGTINDVSGNGRSLSYAGGSSCSSGATQTITFAQSGTTTFTVPAGVTSVSIKAWGAGGGSAGASPFEVGSNGGGGGFAQGTMTVTPGDTLSVVVGGGGGGGGYNGGGGGGGGGGFSAVHKNYVYYLIAGGGGGGGASSGITETGGGGGASGEQGYNGTNNGCTGSTSGVGAGGGAGTQSTGGAGGSGCNSNGNDGTAGSLYQGGTGAGNAGAAAGGVGGSPGGGGGGASLFGAGGGGGGYYGGGGGETTSNAVDSEGAGGGGGGSSYIVSSAAATSTVGGSGQTPGNTGDSAYTGNAGLGAASSTSGTAGAVGNDGLIVLTYTQISACDSPTDSPAVFTAVGTSTWSVPLGVTAVTVKVWGAGGGSGSSGSNGTQNGGQGGGGGFVQGTFAVTPGDTLSVLVGGGGGGGLKGSPFAGGGGAGGGGGFSAVHKNYTYYLIAGGGGGGGASGDGTGEHGGVGGPGGGTTGTNGARGLDTGTCTGGTVDVGDNGDGGTQSSGGSGGSGCNASSDGTNGTALQGGIGGNGGTAGKDGGAGGTVGGGAGGSGNSGGGGGGGGYYGGGGAEKGNQEGAGGGGGGSSYLASSLTATSTTSGNGTAAGNNTDGNYAGNAGMGAATTTSGGVNGAAGNNGRVVISYVGGSGAGLTQTQGAIGQGMYFNGAIDAASTTSAINGIQTIAFWANPTTTTQSILALGPSGKNVTLVGGVVTTGLASPTIYVDGVVTTIFPSDKQWHHVVIMTSSAVNATAFTVGMASSTYYGGGIDDVRLYSRTLSADEVMRLYGLGDGTRIGVTLSTNPAQQNGLITWWTFDGKDIDLSKNTAEIRDRSATGLNGDWKNHASTTVPGAIGQGISFDGLDGATAGDVVTAADNAVFDSLGSVTVAAWVRPTALGQANIVIKQHNTSPFMSFQLWMTSGNIVKFDVENTSLTLGSISSNTTLAVGNWYHVVGTWTAGQSPKIYINGIDVSTSASGAPTGTLLNSDGNLSVGGDGSNDNINAALDDIRVYNRALAPAEVSRLYQMGATTRVGVAIPPRGVDVAQQSDLIGWWTMDGPYINLALPTAEIRDRSGQNINGDWKNHASTTAPGAIGQAISLDGVDDFIDLGTNYSFQPSNPFSISAWVYTNDDTQSKGIISHRHSTGGGWDVVINTSEQIEWTICTSGSLRNFIVTSGTPSISLGKWIHVVATYNGTNANGMHIYINGVEKAATIVDNDSGASISYLTNARIGSTQGSSYMKGRLDDVRVYNRALSLVEVQRLYKMGK